jgi:uncharacterized protein YjbI with pentapeptide repeats
MPPDLSNDKPEQNPNNLPSIAPESASGEASVSPASSQAEQLEQNIAGNDTLNLNLLDIVSDNTAQNDGQESNVQKLDMQKKEAIVHAAIAKSKETGRPIDLSNQDLSGLDFTDKNKFPDINFEKANFKGACLSGCNLSRHELVQVDFTNANLAGANISFADITSARMEKANLSNTNLSNSSLSYIYIADTSFDGADLKYTTLRELHFTRCTFKNSDLSKSYVTGVEFEGIDLREMICKKVITLNTSFDRCNLAGQDLSGWDLMGVGFDNSKLDDVTFKKSILKQAKFENCDLSGHDFSGHNLSYARFENTKLEGTIFTGANLSDAKFIDCDLSGQDFSNCNLQAAAFTESQVLNANFTNANLVDAKINLADLSGATINGAKFFRADLSMSELNVSETIWGAYLGAHLSKDIPANLSQELLLINGGSPLQRWQIVAANIAWREADKDNSSIEKAKQFIEQYKELCNKGPKAVLQIADNLSDTIHCLNNKVISPAYAKLLTALANELVTPDSNGKVAIPSEEILDYVKKINPGTFRDAHRYLDKDTVPGHTDRTIFEYLYQDENYSKIANYADKSPEAMYALKVTNVFGNNWKQWIDIHEQKKLAQLIEQNPRLQENLKSPELDAQLAKLNQENTELREKIQNGQEADTREKYIDQIKKNSQAIKELQAKQNAKLEHEYNKLKDLFVSELKQVHHDACIWLPVGTQQQLAGLGDYLLRHSDRSITDLEIIAKNWKDLKPEQKELSFEVLIKELKSNIYPNAKSYEFAVEAAKWGISQEEYPEMERRFLISQSVPSPFPQDKAWSVTGENGSKYTGRFLPRTDPRGIFLGQHSASCQHPKGESAQAAWYGQERPNSGFFVVEDSEGKIVGQSWAWVSDNGGLCFDNVEAKELGNRKTAVREIYQLAAQDLSSKYHTIALGTVMSKVDVLDLPEAAQLNETDPNKVKALELPSDFMAERVGVMQGGWADSFNKDGTAAQVILACNPELPKLNSPPYPTWVSAGTDKDKEALRKIVEACYPEGFQWVDAGEHIVLRSRDGGVIGYAAIDTQNRYIGDLAVMPEHRQHSKLLIDALANYLQQHGADKEWSLDSRPSTSYILLRRAEKDGLITITNDTASSTQLPPEDMTDREKRNLERALGRLGVPENERNNMRRITFRAAVPIKVRPAESAPNANAEVPVITEIALDNLSGSISLDSEASKITIDEKPASPKRIAKGSVESVATTEAAGNKPATEIKPEELASHEHGSKSNPSERNTPATGRAFLIMLGLSAAIERLKRGHASTQHASSEDNAYNIY